MTNPKHQIEVVTATSEQAVGRDRQSGKIGWAILWLLGVPLPVLLVLYLIRGH